MKRISISLIFIFFTSVGFSQNMEKPIVKNPPPPPPPPIEEIIFVSQELPRFPGCEDNDLTKAEKQKCAEQKLLDFIYGNIEWPHPEYCGTGMVVVGFIIEKDGSVSNPKIIKDIGGGAGEEAIRVVKMMPDWIPAKQGGKFVRVQYNLPVRFRLE